MSIQHFFGPESLQKQWAEFEKFCPLVGISVTEANLDLLHKACTARNEGKAAIFLESALRIGYFDVIDQLEKDPDFVRHQQREQERAATQREAERVARLHAKDREAGYRGNFRHKTEEEIEADAKSENERRRAAWEAAEKERVEAPKRQAAEQAAREARETDYSVVPTVAEIQERLQATGRGFGSELAKFSKQQIKVYLRREADARFNLTAAQSRPPKRRDD